MHFAERVENQVLDERFVSRNQNRKCLTLAIYQDLGQFVEKVHPSFLGS